MPRTIKVRIAVAIAVGDLPRGAQRPYAANRDCCYKDERESEQASEWCARNELGDQSAPVVWVEAEVPVPEPVVVTGSVVS